MKPSWRPQGTLGSADTSPITVVLVVAFGYAPFAFVLGIFSGFWLAGYAWGFSCLVIALAATQTGMGFGPGKSWKKEVGEVFLILSMLSAAAGALCVGAFRVLSFDAAAIIVIAICFVGVLLLFLDGVIALEDFVWDLLIGVAFVGAVLAFQSPPGSEEHEGELPEAITVRVSVVMEDNSAAPFAEVYYRWAKEGSDAITNEIENFERSYADKDGRNERKFFNAHVGEYLIVVAESDVELEDKSALLMPASTTEHDFEPGEVRDVILILKSSKSDTGDNQDSQGN